MPAITLMYSGQRKTVNVAPRSLVQELVRHAAEQFRLGESQIVLRYKSTTLDSAQTFFMYNIPNNAVVDVEVSVSLQSSTTAQTKVILVVQDKSTLSASFR
jgi:hypothetical protein